MKPYLGVATVGGLALLTVACTPAGPASAREPASTASAGQAVAVTMTDLQFTPSTVTVKAGTPVTVTAANKGVIEHTWAVTVGSEAVQIDARPGQTATKTFTPTAPGTYLVICTVPGHEQAGMQGTLVVE